jgi:CRP-like cAMP-binding protein
LTETDIEALTEIVERVRIPAGETLITEGEYSDFLFAIDDGVVRVTKDFSGTTIEISEFTSGEVLGEISFVDGVPPSATVMADTDVQVLRFPVAAIRELVMRKPTLGINLYHSIAATLATRLRVATERFASEAMFYYGG